MSEWSDVSDYLPSSLCDDVMNYSLTIPRLLKSNKHELFPIMLQALSDYQQYLFDGIFFPSPIQLVQNSAIPLTLEAVTVACTNRSPFNDEGDVSFCDKFQLVRAHADTFNCNNSIPSRAALVSFKIVDDNYQLTTIIGYSRRSVYDLLVRRESYKSIAAEITRCIRDIPQSRHSLCSQLVDGNNLSVEHDQIQLYTFPQMLMRQTNFDSNAAFQGVYFGILMVARCFSLNFVEIISLLSVLEFCANCTYYFNCVIVFYLLEERWKERSPHDGFGIGVDFGFNFLELTEKVYIYERKNSVSGTVPLLFN